MTTGPLLESGRHQSHAVSAPAGLRVNSRRVCAARQQRRERAAGSAPPPRPLPDPRLWRRSLPPRSSGHATVPPTSAVPAATPAMTPAGVRPAPASSHANPSATTACRPPVRASDVHHLDGLARPGTRPRPRNLMSLVRGLHYPPPPTPTRRMARPHPVPREAHAPTLANPGGYPPSRPKERRGVASSISVRVSRTGPT